MLSGEKKPSADFRQQRASFTRYHLCSRRDSQFSLPSQRLPIKSYPITEITRESLLGIWTARGSHPPAMYLSLPAQSHMLSAFQASGLEATFRITSFRRPFSIPVGTAALSIKGQCVLLFVMAFVLCFFLFPTISPSRDFVKKNMRCPGLAAGY